MLNKDICAACKGYDLDDTFCSGWVCPENHIEDNMFLARWIQMEDNPPATCRKKFEYAIAVGMGSVNIDKTRD